MNEALQAAMFFADSKFLPDLEAAAFDEVLARALAGEISSLSGA